MQIEIKNFRYFKLNWQTSCALVGRHLGSQWAASDKKSVLMSGVRGLWNPQEEAL